MMFTAEVTFMFRAMGGGSILTYLRFAKDKLSPWFGANMKTYSDR